MLDTIQQFGKRWFLSEPPLFSIYCFHELIENRDMMCEVRSGRGRIEYNPDMLTKHSLKDQEMILRAELIRLLLQHPYSRKPEGCSQSAISLASDFVITSYYPEMCSLFATPLAYDLPEKHYYEWYAGRIREYESKNVSMMPSGGSNLQGDKGDPDKQRSVSKQGQEATPSSVTMPGQSSDKSEGECSDSCNGPEVGIEGDAQQLLKDRSGLWEENPWMQEEVRNVVRRTNDWGTIPGSVVEQIVANAKLKVDYRKVLSGFRANTLSTKRKLTRMRPNRRTEFENMGSLYQLQTRYLCAIDVSGSISSDDLKNFFSIINRFFKYGVERVDVVTCDTEIHDVIEFKKAKSLISVSGRGGTSFQPVINYMEEHPEYDGLIFFTDGYAHAPEIHKKGLTQNILWFLNCEEAYHTTKDGLRKIGRVCYLNT